MANQSTAKMLATMSRLTKTPVANSIDTSPHATTTEYPAPQLNPAEDLKNLISKILHPEADMTHTIVDRG
ncbi:MAG: hypothetical protein Q8M40_01050 [Legionella sp.]|nr:hypothetical protein [Legionella sp.]